MSSFFIACCTALLVIFLIQAIGKVISSGAYKQSRRGTQQYIKEKLILDNKHCSNLPSIDTRGIFGGISGSFTDKTGKFSAAYQNELDQLNAKYGIPMSGKKNE